MESSTLMVNKWSIKLVSIMKNMGAMHTRGYVFSFNTLRDIKKFRVDLLNIDLVDGRSLSKNYLYL